MLDKAMKIGGVSETREQEGNYGILQDMPELWGQHRFG